MDRIVVGVDGSETSQRALAWALEDARRRGGATVEAVHAWEPPVLVGGPVGTVPPVPVDGPYTDAGHQLVTDVLAAVDTTGVTVEPVVLEGPPGAVLCDRSTDAALLVLGSHGHGRFATAMLGSTSHTVLHHAPCPVAVVRGDR